MDIEGVVEKFVYYGLLIFVWPPIVILRFILPQKQRERLNTWLSKKGAEYRKKAEML